MRRLITFLDNQMAICISWILKLGHLMNDRRQAYVYLLAASYLYPKQKATALFYNLESGKFSEPINATSAQLDAIQIELARIAQQHQKDLSNYRHNPTKFKQIFPASPSFNCRYCSFNSICELAISEVSA